MSGASRLQMRRGSFAGGDLLVRCGRLRVALAELLLLPLLAAARLPRYLGLVSAFRECIAISVFVAVQG
jgi:hypothetical protein